MGFLDRDGLRRRLDAERGTSPDVLAGRRHLVAEWVSVGTGAAQAAAASVEPVIAARLEWAAGVGRRAGRRAGVAVGLCLALAFLVATVLRVMP